MPQIIEVINVNSSWSETISAYIALLQGGSPEGKQLAQERFVILAKELDDNQTLFEASPTLFRLLREWLEIDDWQDGDIAPLDLVERTKALIEYIDAKDKP